jgi:hypothetical protein
VAVVVQCDFCGEEIVGSPTTHEITSRTFSDDNATFDYCSLCAMAVVRLLDAQRAWADACQEGTPGRLPTWELRTPVSAGAPKPGSWSEAEGQTIASLNISARTRSALSRAGLTSCADLVEWSNEELHRIRGIGWLGVQQIRDALDELSGDRAAPASEPS